MREALLLIKNGWPPDAAFALDDAYRAAFVVALQEMEGIQNFNWDSGQWEDRKS